MQKQIDLGLVAFRDDHTQPPFRKAHLVPVAEELDVEVADAEEEEGEEDEGSEETTAGLQVMPSVIYKQSQVAVSRRRGVPMAPARAIRKGEERSVPCGRARLREGLAETSGGGSGLI